MNGSEKVEVFCICERLLSSAQLAEDLIEWARELHFFPVAICMSSRCVLLINLTTLRFMAICYIAGFDVWYFTLNNLCYGSPAGQPDVGVLCAGPTALCVFSLTLPFHSLHSSIILHSPC